MDTRDADVPFDNSYKLASMAPNSIDRSPTDAVYDLGSHPLPSHEALSGSYRELCEYLSNKARLLVPTALL
ncbi:hypothetical protein OUZ56_007064 [Daphnia magna]|uniref:Uncharacterized protein n=1 Tax=Daphnia magna TaxID=35525 RepID=A0ABQ9YXH4_9CRUS|nr:hypothetical protein OUZ56_007064 [Daphnia magna]